MNSQNTFLIIAGVLFLTLLVFYIIARVKVKKDELVLTANTWDMIMLFACPIAIFIAWCWGFDHPLNTIQIVLLVIAGACFVGTAIMSIVHNEDNTKHIIISILAKLFIVWLTLIVILLLIVILVITVMLSFVSSHDDGDEYILLKYDRALHAYVGYKI